MYSNGRSCKGSGQDRPIRVLLIEDDEDDRILVQAMLRAVPFQEFDLKWAADCDRALEAMQEGTYDVCLLDYRLGKWDGLKLLREAIARGFSTPTILLTGHGDYKVDLEAMKMGATDYLVKSQINPPLMERAIRYAIERKRSEEALRQSEKELRKLSSRLLSAQEEERKRIARDLHDSTCQSLGVIKLVLHKALRQLNEDSSAADTIGPLLPLVGQATEELRRIIKDLRPSTLDDLGILSTISSLCREFGEKNPGIRVVENTRALECEIPEDLKVVIYRILQEALNNVAKHSRASHVCVSLVKTDGALELCVEDNGDGFKPGQAEPETGSNGIGLSSMRERAELSGGSFALESDSRSGTRVSAAWPAPRPSLAQAM